jgi:hypothetical protein
MKVTRWLTDNIDSCSSEQEIDARSPSGIKSQKSREITGCKIHRWKKYFLTENQMR